MKVQKRRRKKRQDRLVLNLLIIVTIVLVLFEGKLVVTMITHRSANTSSEAGEAEAKPASSGSVEKEPESGDPSASAAGSGAGSMEASLAGLPQNISSSGSADAPAEGSGAGATLPTVSDPTSSAIVPKSDTPVDDSYFADAAFIGDSRMEGFRNASGITQGRFFTSVGMSLSSMSGDSVIQTADGNITVAAALSGGSYNKIYLMLGTNDLGEYDWEAFREGFVSVTKRFQEIQPNALIYICSVIYVEESKVASGEYVNNANVDKINSILLQVCEEQGYHYLDLNEFLSNGYGSLIDGASSDGVHIYPEYCEQMLSYLKSHYIVAEAPADDAAKDKGEESESETETSGDSE